MELNLNEDILLVGEANFSFTISLADYCKNRSLITTTCYESLDDLKRIFGETQIETNFSLLNSLDVNKIFFNIDATSIHENCELSKIKYSKIIFMFPHACCKKTNLKLNRKLLEGFLLSSKFLLKTNGCVYVTLARGQGGTKFDVNLNPTSEMKNDNWQLVQIANSCGYLLTECYKFDSNKFQYYQSTGYKIQNKSFNTEMSLVHKLELSLSFDEINFCLSSELVSLKYLLYEKFNLHNQIEQSISSKSCFINEFLKTSLVFFEDKLVENNPLIKLKNTILSFIRNELSVHLFQNYYDLHFSSKAQTNYCVGDYFIRDHLNSQDLVCKLAENQLNICSALLLDDNEIDQELNNYKYEILFHYKSISDNQMFDKIQNFITNVLINKILKGNSCVQEDNYIYSINQKTLFKFNKPSNDFICELDAGYLCQLVNKIEDKRLLFSNDRRTFSNEHSFLIQTVRYTHDLCFWYNRNDFDEKKFLNLIRDLSYNQIRYAILIDRNFKKVNLKYKNDFDDDENIYSAFYRFIYESYDKTLDFDSARYIQDTIREQIKLKLNLVPR
jgi:hypothetical protein